MNTKIVLVKDTLNRATSATQPVRKVVITPCRRGNIDSPIQNSDFDEFTYMDRYSIIIEHPTPVAIMYAQMSRTGVNYDGSRFIPGYQYHPIQTFIDTTFVVGGLRSRIHTTLTDFIAIARGASTVIGGSSGLIVVGEGSTVSCGDSCLVVAEPHFDITTRTGTVLDLAGPGTITVYDLDGNTAKIEVENGICGVATPMGIIQPSESEMRTIITRLPLNMIDYSMYGTRMGIPYRQRTPAV